MPQSVSPYDIMMASLGSAQTLNDIERCSAAKREAFAALHSICVPFLPYPAPTHPPNSFKTHPMDADWTDYSDLLLIPLSLKRSLSFRGL